MIENIHKVSKRQWKKWDEKSQELFNSLFEHMTLEYTDDDGNVVGPGAGQNLYTHPKTIPIPDEYWKTTAWNASYMAADLLRVMNNKETKETENV